MDTSLIIALISLLGSVVVNIVQLVKTKGENKKLAAESSTMMIETALKMNRQEIDTLRALYEDLNTRYKEEVKRNEDCKRLLDEKEKAP